MISSHPGDPGAKRGLKLLSKQVCNCSRHESGSPKSGWGHLWDAAAEDKRVIYIYIYIYYKYIYYIYIYLYIYIYTMFEGSLEIKLPTIWTDEKQSRAEAERRGRLEERRSEEKE